MYRAVQLSTCRRLAAPSGGLVFKAGHSPKRRQRRYPVSNNYFAPLDVSLGLSKHEKQNAVSSGANFALII
jgi:hypothetical protein